MKTTLLRSVLFVGLLAGGLFLGGSLMTASPAEARCYRSCSRVYKCFRSYRYVTRRYCRRQRRCVRSYICAGADDGYRQAHGCSYRVRCSYSPVCSYRRVSIPVRRCGYRSVCRTRCTRARTRYRYQYRRTYRYYRNGRRYYYRRTYRYRRY
jgi:hypothetical protein